MNRILLFVVAVTATLYCSARPKVGREALDKEIELFRSSKELKQITEHNGQGIYVYYFKYTCKGSEIAEPSFRPPMLKRLETAFDDNGVTALSRYSHRSTDGTSPMKALVFSWPNTYRNSVSFYFSLNDTMDYRFVTYSHPDTVRACYALVWSETRFNDHAGTPYRCFDGYIMTLTGNHWDYDTSLYKYFYADDPRLRNAGRDASDAHSEELDYAMLTAKMDELDKLFNEAKHTDNVQKMNAACYTAGKLLRNYNGKITPQQGAQLGSVLQQWNKSCGNSIVDFRIFEVMGMLSQKIENVGSDKVDSSITTTSSGFFTDNLQKNSDRRDFYRHFSYNSSDMGEAYPWELTGTCSENSRFVCVNSRPLVDKEYLRKVENGNFCFTQRLQRGQFVAVNDDWGKRTWWIINDSLPVKLNMIDGTVEGSDLNKRFVSYQRRIRNMAKDIQKYAILMDGSMDIVDEAGYNSVVDSVRKIQYEAINDNKDNIIPAFYISELCTEMPPEMLDSVMRHGLAYSDHVAMQPAWAFYEGQKKRLPGQDYHDVELQDIDGKTHRLSEYVGKGNYVLLHFWATWGNDSRRELKIIKQIVNDNKDKPLTVIGISLNKNGKDWKDYVTARKMKWTQLSNVDDFDSPIARAYGVVTMPMTVLISPEGKIVAQGMRNEEILQALGRGF